MNSNEYSQALECSTNKGDGARSCEYKGGYSGRTQRGGGGRAGPAFERALPLVRVPAARHILVPRPRRPHGALQQPALRGARQRAPDTQAVPRHSRRVHMPGLQWHRVAGRVVGHHRSVKDRHRGGPPVLGAEVWGGADDHRRAHH